MADVEAGALNVIIQPRKWFCSYHSQQFSALSAGNIVTRWLSSATESAHAVYSLVPGQNNSMPEEAVSGLFYGNSTQRWVPLFVIVSGHRHE